MACYLYNYKQATDLPLSQKDTPAAVHICFQRATQDHFANPTELPSAQNFFVGKKAGSP